MSKKKLTAKRKKQLLTMFAVAGVMGNTGIAPTMALADTLTPTAETATEQTQANEAKEVIDQTIQNVTDPLVNPTDSTTTTSDSLATTDEATDETTDDTQDQATEQEQATAATADSEGDATNPTAEAPKVAQKANVAAASEITGTWGTSPYTFDENTGVLTIGAGELSGYKESPWNSKKVDAKSIKKIVLSGKVVAPEDSRRLFSYSYLTNVTEIEGLSQLDTSNVTNMEYMFHGMRSVTSLDVSGFDTSNVTNMDAMFYSMSNVTSLDVSGFDTSKVTEMAFMFDSMSRLTSLDLNSFDTSKVTVMDSMFFGMQSLTSLDISGFDTSNVAYMGDMFRRMSSLTSLDLSNFDTSKVTDMGAMFADTPLKKLILGDTFKFVESGSENAKLTSAWKRADGKGKVYTAADFMNNYGTGDLTAGTYVSATGWWGTSPYNFDENTGTLTIEAGELSGYEKSPWNSGTVDYEAIKKIVLSGKVVAPKYSGYLFSSTYTGKQLKNVTEIEGLSQLDTSNVTDMRCMFSDMRSVINLDVSGFDTSNVTSMNYMFKNMSSITSLDVSGFDTSNVTGMYTMFQGLSRVTSLDLSNFDTHKVTDMRDMFVDTPLKKLILGDTFKFVESGSENAKLTSAWKREDGTGKVYTAEDFMKNYGTGDLTAGTYVSVETGTWGTSPYMFDENTGVLTIEAGELSGYEESPWNSDKVDSEAIKKIVLAGKVVAPEDSSNLFSYSYLKNVTEIDGLSQLDTSNVTDMREMFRGMNSITSLDLSGFDTSNVTDMYAMFYDMSNLTSLDLSNFDTSKVTDMSYMFEGMSSVTSLDLSGFDTSKVTDMSDMFLIVPLNKLTLGDHFKAVGDTGLSAPKALNEGDQLTGNWIREDGQSKGYSPADFMTNYGTGDLTAGTYVAELVKSELKPQEYHVGDVNITGTYTGDMSLGRLTVNGKVVSWGGSFKDGQFSYYVGAGKLKVGDKVVLDGYNKEKELIDSKEIEVISESSGSIDQADTYKLGDSTITGTYTGDIHKGKLVVNGEVVSWGGTYKDGKFSYYVNSQIIKAGDQATIQGYDKFDTPLGDPQSVTIGEQLGQLTEAHRVGISTVIEGNYTGDVYQGILLVNGEKVSQGGSFKDGKFSYYVGNLKVSEDDQVVLMGANNRGQQIPGSEIGVTIQTPTAEINELTYKIGTQTIKGAYGSDTQVHQGHLFVNGKLISKGGSFKDGAISYYVKPDLIKADDQVTMNFYDGSGNLLAENQTVSVN
ncbi:MULTISPECIES: BspA family leucine-rich repeat surface protein [Enterococcus]|nr:BspA family leucine-rich repeat surface protein [Enterococcus hirae]EMF0181640.1 BspA family leucine-rich repeat surface protein [Enterococcus hirae]EMF0196962.1 BspA family leucine-rich repeat surface protein [Enterococcus hirae]EMF0204696.1 BspA family leucine-rich repeat surface protein [Enterococcus hirae]EMF0463538.1 BspA family leucine-rich repeat surface protein [Enterococcus hirae]UYT96140.1 BspA family leucine-rich repeat surface protein [Enterococcus hirae]